MELPEEQNHQRVIADGQRQDQQLLVWLQAKDQKQVELMVPRY